MEEQIKMLESIGFSEEFIQSIVDYDSNVPEVQLTPISNEVEEVNAGLTSNMIIDKPHVPYFNNIIINQSAK